METELENKRLNKIFEVIKAEHIQPVIIIGIKDKEKDNATTGGHLEFSFIENKQQGLTLLGDLDFVKNRLMKCIEEKWGDE